MRERSRPCVTGRRQLIRGPSIHSRAAPGRAKHVPPQRGRGVAFPDSFQDSPLGKIPKGWAVGKLGDVAENAKRSVKPEHLHDSTCYIGLEHMPRRCIGLSDWGTVGTVTSGKSGKTSRFCMLARQLVPALVGAFPDGAVDQARTRVVLASLAVRRMGMDTNTFPADLEELAPKYLVQRIAR